MTAPRKWLFWCVILILWLGMAAIATCELFVRDMIKERPAVCETHQCHLKKRFVEIGYCLPSRRTILERAVAGSKFPHAGFYILGGCCVQSEKWARVYVCANCVSGYQAWKPEWDQLTDGEIEKELDRLNENWRRTRLESR
jgi:hypothetical protein